MKFTSGIKLKKPELSDYFNIDNDNANMDIIDSALSGLVTTTGTANSYIANIPWVTALTAGIKFTLKVHAATTGAATLNVSGLGVKAITKAGGGNATLKVGVYNLAYDGTSFQLLGEGGEYGTARAADTLIGKTIGLDSGLVDGTMPNVGKQISRISTKLGKQFITKGYHDGTGYIDYDNGNHVAGNIKEGVDIGGVVGTLPLGVTLTSTLVVKPMTSIASGATILLHTLPANWELVTITNKGDKYSNYFDQACMMLGDDAITYNGVPYYLSHVVLVRDKATNQVTSTAFFGAADSSSNLFGYKQIFTLTNNKIQYKNFGDPGDIKVDVEIKVVS